MQMMGLLFVKENIRWTEHAKTKMRQYRLSESRVKRVLRFPKRLEGGVAPKTVAGMQAAGSKKHPYEIWVMWQQKVKNQKGRTIPFTRGRSLTKIKIPEKQIIIISAWKYPGESPVHEPPPIPNDVWEIIKKERKKPETNKD